jgi:phosphotriesterase-related protein
MLTRRELLLGAVPLVGPSYAGRVMTVRGPIADSSLGTTLVHEHALVDFIGADKVSRDRYDADEAFRVILPHLQQVSHLGARTFVDCTPAYIGRDPQLLRRLSEASGLHIVTTTGYYGAADDKFVPRQAYSDDTAALARRWIREFDQGIEGTEIRPGIIKTGVDAGPLSAIDAKLLAAAALTHRATGLTIAAHTGNGVAAIEEIDLIATYGVAPSAFIWVHAQNEKDPAAHREAARRGAWVAFDGIGPKSVDRHVDLVVQMARARLLHRVLVSMDAGWYRVGEPGGGAYRPHDTLFTEFVPRARRVLGQATVRQLLLDNPARALALRSRIL